MPRGIPNSGLRAARRTKAEMQAARNHVVLMEQPEVFETDREIEDRIRERFDVLREIAEGTVVGDVRALVVSGPAGLGKSFTIEDVMKREQPAHAIIKGYVKATGLFRRLWDHREKGNVLIFDDADSIFQDEVALNMLKAVCDTTEQRWVSYLADYDMVDDEGSAIPRTFLFEGSIIFITNLNFDDQIARGSRLAPHMEALQSRAYYVDCGLRNRRDYIIRIKQVISDGMLREQGLTPSQEADTVNFIVENQDNLREVSLRIAVKIGALVRSKPASWKRIARVTCCR